MYLKENFIYDLITYHLSFNYFIEKCSYLFMIEIKVCEAK